jgi:acyl-coenzyme A thioesterase PaaI-like protein
MATAAIGEGVESVVTITCNNEFLGPACAGDLVTGRGEVTRRGGSLIFTRAVLEANGKVILTSSAVLKRLRPSV